MISSGSWRGQTDGRFALNAVTCLEVECSRHADLS